ncbi:MAG: 23S rRNA (guanosine(2251)-2'-O)-methyltransferase RlmB [bacterium]|nr:23S rRNA (guanosine(2251)-2'-O)-methyltransferase RlmB [bacterium]
MQIEGKNAVNELLNSNLTIEKISVLDKTTDAKLREIINQAREKGIKVEFVPKTNLDKNSQTGHHQGVIALATEFVYADLEDVVSKNKNGNLFFIILDNVMDPHNLGSVLRVADCAGVTAVIIPKNRSAVVNETVIRTSAGATAFVPVCKVTNLASAIKYLKENGVWVYAADMNGKDMSEVNLKGNVAIVIGNEGSGVSDLVKKESDEIISIPMFGKINSLNASVSAGILAYEVVKQNKKG